MSDGSRERGCKTMKNREYLTIGRSRDLILQRFNGKNRVPTREIVTYVETVHCNGVGELSANEKMIVSDALISLRKVGLADNPERGHWSFQDQKHSNTDSNGATNPIHIRKNMSANSDFKPERIIGSGRSSVYLYYYQKYRESAESKGESVWECKIGMTIHGVLDGRIKEQATGLPEIPKIGLHIKTDMHEKIERILHDILKVRGKFIDAAPGAEWFLTSPSEVEEIYNFIGERSCEGTLDM